MTLPAQTTHNDFDATDVSDASPPEASSRAGEPVVEDAAALETTISIELNFNAFADHVPPTQHAKRVARLDDPSIQDFADQALEIATLRAELKRLNHDYDSLQHGIRIRDAWLQTLRAELASAQTELLNLRRQLSESASHVEPRKQSESDTGTPMASKVAAEAVEPGPKVVAATGKSAPPLEAESAPALEAESAPAAEPGPPATPQPIDGSATIPAMQPLVHSARIVPLAPKRQLIPVDHDGESILLCRDIIKIGRTRDNDVCIHSRAVSRDHARLLIGAASVTIVDMDSANGCFVNDEPVKRHKLRDGDILRIGDRSYRFSSAPGVAAAHLS